MLADNGRASPELGERRSSRATRVKWWQWWGSAGACSDVGEEERGAVSGVGCSGVEVPFYSGRVMIMAVIGGEMGGNVNGDLSVLKL
jgi:hypothetical protein